MGRRTDHLPLRKVGTNAEHLVQRLLDHVVNGFVPKVERLNEIVDEAIADSHAVEDVTLRHATARVLESENFTAELFDETTEFLDALDQAVEELVSRKTLK